MGWEIPWYTITDDFDTDFDVGEWHGTNAFLRDGDRIFRTYFIDGRGDEAMGSTWSYLDITALGRQEEWEDSPDGYPQTPPYQWWRLPRRVRADRGGPVTVLAHVGALPVEELLALAPAAGADARRPCGAATPKRCRKPRWGFSRRRPRPSTSRSGRRSRTWSGSSRSPRTGR